MSRPFLLALGGRTGTGKTTLAYALAATPSAFHDALVIGDDETRRELLGLDIRTPMPPDAYAPAVTARVTALIETRTMQALAQGRVVINHAGFYAPESQDRIRQFAASIPVPFIGLWLTAAETTLVARVEKRLAERAQQAQLQVEAGHASDACLGVLLDKFKDMRPPENPAWHRLDTEAKQTDVCQRALSILSALQP